MARFVGHEACPKCKSRDNLGRYDDSSAWCFGCGYFERPIRTIENSKLPQKREDISQQSERDDFLNNDGDYTSNLPEKPLKWLKSYGITDDEIQLHSIVYSPQRESLLLGTQWRYFGGNANHPKAVTFDKSGHPMEIGSNPDIGIFVEDFISAIKVGRSFTGLPIFGSWIDASSLKRALERFKLVGIWLDSDKAAVGARIAQKGRLLGGARVFRINTVLDPKCYSTERIKEIVENEIPHG